MSDRFGDWHALEEAGACAPTGPGVFQVRLRNGLVDYPGGRSAMVFYGSGRDVACAISEFGTQLVPELPWTAQELLARWMPAEEHQQRLQRYRGRFLARFGAPPRANAARMQA